MATDQASLPGLSSEADSAEVLAAAHAGCSQQYAVLNADELVGEKNARIFQCTLCEKKYERLDHIKRHIKSHENTRPFKCDLCPKQFNRRDLLIRHQTGHDDASRDLGGKRKRASRAIQACQACTTAKTKCEDRRPCRRCEKREIPCVDGELSRKSALPSTMSMLQFSSPKAPTMQNAGAAYSSSVDVGVIEMQDADGDDVSQQQDTRFAASSPPSTQPPLVSDHPGQQEFMPVPNDNHQGSSIPLDPWWDNVDWQNLNFFADLGHIYQDVDFQFDNELPSIAGDSWMNVDTPQDGAMVTSMDSNAAPAVTDDSAPHPRARTSTTGHEAFKKSPWLWTPSRQDHAYSSQAQLAVNEAHIMESPEMVNPTGASPVSLPKLSGSGGRDEMLSMLVKFSKSTFKIRSFPSHNLLNVLMQALLVRDNSGSDACIHTATFNPDACRTELLAGVVAAGSTYFAISNIWKMGLALQEIVKLAICDSLDNDNRLARDLETNQTFLMWTEIGLWSGFRRKMEVAEGFASTLPTMLRRAGAFDQNYYSTSPIPTMADDGVALKRKWLQWIEMESYRRLVFRVFINEIRASIAFVRKPLLSGVELTLTLPAARDLWDASSAQEWKAVYLTKGGAKGTNLTLLEILRDPQSLEADRNILDLALASQAALYAIWDDVWSLSDAKIRHPSTSLGPSRATTQLWLQARHQELYGSLKSLRQNLENLNAVAPETELLCELLMMFLHSSATDIQSFAGRFGEQAGKSALPKLREWVASGDSYIATWHAGQVLRAARQLPPTSLRGFLAIAVYHASLLLWITTWLSKKASASSHSSPTAEGEGRVNRDASGVRAQQDAQVMSDWVLLDGSETMQARKYTANKTGKPALHLGGKPVSLNDLTTIPAAMTEIFRQNYPSRDHPLPPLLENLSNLMEELNQTR